MLRRSSSRDYGAAGDATPRAACFSKQQTADYLSNLRNNRPARPSGSRPPPSSSPPKRRSMSKDDLYGTRKSTSSSRASFELNHSRSSSVLSYYQGAGSVSSGRSSPEKMFYAAAHRDMEQRESEREEALRMRLALQASNDDPHAYSAAQQEAAELIWKHQNPNAPYRVRPDREKVLEQQHAPLEAAYDYPIDPAQYDDSCEDLADTAATPVPGKDRQPSPERSPIKRLSSRFSLSRMSGKRRSITSLRDVSGTVKKAVFPNSRDHIWEDDQRTARDAPNRAPSPEKMSSQTRRNPFARAQAARQNQQVAYDRSDVMKSLKSIQAKREDPGWNAGYTSNRSPPPSSPSKTPTDPSDSPVEAGVKYRDGVEVRSDDIRAATSMRRADRSPRLPSPTVVSDNPSRPIVSFDSNWQPPADEEPELQEQLPSPVIAASERRSDSILQDRRFPRKMTPPDQSISHPMGNANMGLGGRAPAGRTKQTSQVNKFGFRNRSSDVPSISVDPEPTVGPARPSRVPDIQVSDDMQPSASDASVAARPAARPARPSRVPDIQVSNDMQPSVPSISVDPEPTQSPSKPARSSTLPAVSSSRPDGAERPAARPSVRSRPFQNGSVDQAGAQPRPAMRHADTAPATAAKGHWTAAARNAPALCAQCALPISGRIVTAAGTRFHPQCFTCYHCNEALECVAFYPEPFGKREERLERIQRRMDGEHVEPPEGVSLEEDSDDALRFYCHLDFHEMFSPRCKSCKTPIEGEVIVACGAQWHVGHFFCAECGDPFSPSIPFVEKEGYAWCINCHTNRSSTRCKKCKKPVTDMVLKALGADWHDECFRCFECNSTFQDGKFFLRGDSQDPICSGCEARRLKA